MDDKTSYPSRDQLAYRLLELTAICGELPANLLDRLHESPSYLEAVIRGLKKDKLLRVYYRDKVRSYRLSVKAKDFLLLDNNERFSFYLTGNSDTNILKSELTRRLRLHRLAHAYVLMLNSDVRVFRDQKPNLFSPDGFTGGYFHTPTFYSSREVKETGLETVKIRGSRMVGTLLSPSGIFVTYSGAQNLADWDYRAELRVKSIHVNMLCNNRLSGYYKSTHVHGLMLNQDMELFFQLISTSDTNTRCFFLMDRNYEHFYYMTNDRYGEVLLKLLCLPKMRSALDRVLSQGLYPRNAGLPIEHDAIDRKGDPVLFSYLLDIPRVNLFYSALQRQERSGTLICFDFQSDILRRCFDARVQIQTIDFAKFEGRFFHR